MRSVLFPLFCLHLGVYGSAQGIRGRSYQASIPAKSNTDRPTTEQCLKILGWKNCKAVDVSGSNIQIASNVLTAMIPGAIDLPGTEEYNESMTHYWSAAAVERAASIVHPASAEEVATTIKVLECFQVPFAVRSGGHQTAHGAAAIKDGILISLDRLHAISYNADNEIVSFGPGNRWLSVYRHLDIYNRGVTGGHIGLVGTGGQITGGGTSPFFHRYGFSSSNVHNFQVVVAGGSIVNANIEENPDLFWALKGGANNFGIVTRLDMVTFPLQGIWSGGLGFDVGKKEEVLGAFWKFQTESIVKDNGTEILLGFGIHGNQSFIRGEAFADSSGYGNESYPDAFKPFYDVGVLYQDAQDQRLAVSANLMASENLPEEGKLWNTPGGEGRMNLAMVTLKPDLQLYSEAVDIYLDTFNAARGVKDAQINLHMSPLTANAVRHAKERGGMAAGWAEEDQLFFNIEMVYSQASDDELMHSLSRECMVKVGALAAERGLLMPTIWMNNAHTEDDVLGSYGAENYAKMKEVSQKYDPKRTFQDLCSGAYKLDK
ncbi:FAD-binding domain-containing protein [Pyrenochaeta sp. DS3sAY3a]|nr:FAD-binding domain-containing protein [Pyrenochaeta sp. DS3sAY3a]